MALLSQTINNAKTNDPMKTIIDTRLSALLGLLLLNSTLNLPALAHTAHNVVTENISSKQPTVTLTVNEKTHNITQPDGTAGFYGQQGLWFTGVIKNQTRNPITLHWHGLQPSATTPILPQGSRRERFLLAHSGTFLLYATQTRSSKTLVAAAPIIVTDPTETKGATHTVLMLLEEGPHHAGHVTYLTNHHTLQKPAVIFVKAREIVHLRLINATLLHHFSVDLNRLVGSTTRAAANEATQQKWSLDPTQCRDLFIKIPTQGGAFPILAQGNDTPTPTGLILKTFNADTPTLLTPSP